MLTVSGGMLGTSLFAWPTRGEAGIAGTSLEAAAKIRSSEISSACKVTKSRPRFFGQIDGDTFVNKEAFAQMAQIIEEDLNPEAHMQKHLSGKEWGE